MELCKAIVYGDARQLASLCKEGRNVSKRTGRGGFMPLHIACAVGYVEAVRMILGNSTAQIAATDLAFNRSPLHWALANAHFECAYLLVQRGATEEALDKEQRSAYDLFRERMQEAELLGESFVAELWTWGDGSSHQLGHGTPERVRAPKKVKGLPDSVKIHSAAITSFSAFVSTNNNSMLSWGAERLRLGQLDGEELVLRPHSIRSLKGRKVVQIAASNYHALAVTDSGEVYSWGYGKDGKLGHESEENVAAPRRVKGGGLERATCLSVCASERHSCVVSTDGDLYTFGYGMEGQLGHSSFSNSSKPKLVTSVRGVICAAASRSHTAVVVSSRKEVYLFGCGVANPTKLHIPKEDVEQCAAVNRGTLFRARSGALYQVEGVGEHLAVPVLVNGAPRRIREISGCEETFAAVDRNGIIYIWSYAAVTNGEAKPKADVYTELRGRVAQLAIAKNSYAAIAYTPRIKASYPLYGSRLADEFAGLIPNALLREMGLSELPLSVDTPGDILLKFVRDKETVLAMAAHRFILYARCAALRPMLEMDDVVLTVEGDVTRSAMMALVYYIYTGRTAALTESGGPSKALKNLARRIGLKALEHDLMEERVASPALFMSDSDSESNLPTSGASSSTSAAKAKRSSLSDDLAAAMQPDGSFPHADITVRLQDEVFRVNRAVLDARSDYFRTLLHAGMLETKKSEIALGSDDITPDAMRTLLRYLYTDELSVGGEQNDDVTALMEVIVAANEMLAEGLKERAESTLMRHLNLSNVIGFAQFAEHYESTNLLDCCLEYLSRHLYLLPSVLTSFSPSLLRRMEELLSESILAEKPTEAMLSQVPTATGADSASPKKGSALNEDEGDGEGEPAAEAAVATEGSSEGLTSSDMMSEPEISETSLGSVALPDSQPASPWKLSSSSLSTQSLAAIQQEEKKASDKKKPRAAVAEQIEKTGKHKRIPLAAFLKTAAAPSKPAVTPAPWAARVKPAAVSLAEVQYKETEEKRSLVHSTEEAKGTPLRGSNSKETSIRNLQETQEAKRGGDVLRNSHEPSIRNSQEKPRNQALQTQPQATPPKCQQDAASPVKSLLEIQQEEMRKLNEIARIKAPPKANFKQIQEEEMRQKKEQDSMRTLLDLGFTEEEARNGLEMFLGDVQQVVANLLYVVEERTSTQAALSTSPSRGGRGRRSGRGRRGQHA